MQTAAEPATAWEWRAMGTTWRIHHGGGVNAEAAAAAAELVERDEARWSRFRPDSEVRALSGRAGQPVEVSAETLDLLDACRHWTGETDGAFQPLVGAALVGWGYRASILDQAPFAAAGPRPQPVAGSIRVDHRRGRALIPAGATLDLGGIGKSWSARRAAALLRERCSGRLLVDAGGDMLAVRGRHLVAIEASDEQIELAEGGAVATSGFGRRCWHTGDGTFAHHLIDPQVGAPAAPAQVTVVCGDVVAADVLATAIAVSPGLLETRSEACKWTPETGAARATLSWSEVCR